jgi:hypothetical protein
MTKSFGSFVPLYAAFNRGDFDAAVFFKECQK